MVECYIKQGLFGSRSYEHFHILKCAQQPEYRVHVTSRHADVFIYIEVSRDDHQPSYFAQPRLFSEKRIFRRRETMNGCCVSQLLSMT